MNKHNKNNILWDLSVFLEGDEDPGIKKHNSELKEANKKFIEKWKERDDYLKDPKVLKEALDEYEKLEAEYSQVGRVYTYFWYRTKQDQENPDLKAKFNKNYEIVRDLGNEILFFGLRVSKIPEEMQAKFLEYSGLAQYRHFLENLFKDAKYLLTEPEEKIINLLSKTSSSNWARMLSEFLSKEEKTVLDEDESKTKKNFSEILKLCSSQNKKVRDTAGKAFNAILDKHLDTSVAEINSLLEYKKTMDELRGFERPDSSRHISDDIDTGVVDSMIDSVSAKFETSKKFYELKAKLLGLKKLEYHERNVEYGELDKKYPYDEAVEIVDKVLGKLDPDFKNIYKQMIDEGRFDVFPKKGKSGGAFCVQILHSQPTFILLNHTDKLTDVLTIAHEMGHALNNHLITRSQNALNSGTPLSTAEVASTFFEDFVLEELMKDVDEPTRLSLMIHTLNDVVSTIYRQAACYKFETDLHRDFRAKGYLSKEDIGSIFTKNMESYMGDYVEQSRGSENWWVYWSHIRSFFYVYSYASGLLISKSLQDMVREDKNNIEKVKEFLSAGMSDSPKNIFMKMGIDISDRQFWNKGLSQVDHLVDEAWDLALKLKKI